MASQPAPYDLRRAGIFNRSGAQAVETENGFVAGIADRKECFRAAQLVALAGETAQGSVQRFFAAVEGFPIMALVDRPGISTNSFSQPWMKFLHLCLADV